MSVKPNVNGLAVECGKNYDGSDATEWTNQDLTEQYGYRYVRIFRPRYTVIYTDGVDDEEIFADQTTSGLLSGEETPAFVGEPVRMGYIFAGWKPDVAQKVAGDVTYEAQWMLNPAASPEGLDDLPQTGDRSRIRIWTAGLLLSGGLLLMRRRKKA